MENIHGLTFIKGGPIDFSNEIKKGENVFVFEFWATWCPPCRNSIPHVSELQKKYKNKNVIFIGITNEEPYQIKDFVEKMGTKMDYIVACDTNQSATRAFMSKYNIQGIPHAFIVGKDGKVAWHGHPMDSSMESYIQSCINVPTKKHIDLTNLNKETLKNMNVKELKEILQTKHIDYSGAIEKQDLIQLIEKHILS
jgi:thiol-disulfide isomerase/thioredoxin